MSTINQLKVISALHGDGQRSTQFEAMLFLGEDTSENGRTFNHLVKTAQFPSIQISQSEIKYKGRKIPVSGIVTYTNTWSCTVYLQDDHEMKIFLEEWMQKSSQQIFWDGVNKFKRKVPEDFYKTIKIEQRNYDDTEKRAVYILRNAFPKSITNISTDYSSVGTTLELQIEFSYSHYEYEVVQAAKNFDVVGSAVNKVQGKINDLVGKVKGITDMKPKDLGAQVQSQQNKLKGNLTGKKNIKDNPSDIKQTNSKGQLPSGHDVGLHGERTQ